MASHGKDWPEFPGFCRNSYYEPGFRNPALFIGTDMDMPVKKTAALRNNS